MPDTQNPTLKVEAIPAADSHPATRKTVSFSIGDAAAIQIDLLDLQTFLNQLPNLRPGSGQKASMEFPAFTPSTAV